MRATDCTGLLVTTGAGTIVLASKKRLQERCNRLFSIVSASRTLDLEAESEAERHWWVRAFGAFVRRCTTPTDDASLAGAVSAFSSDHDGLNFRTSAELGVGLGAALGGLSGAGSLAGDVDEELVISDGVFAHLANTDSTDGSSSAVQFPRLRDTMLVRTGDLSGRWQQMELELADGEIVSTGRGALPLRCVGALGRSDEADEADAASRCSDSEEGLAAEGAGVPAVDLRLRLRLHGAGGATGFRGGSGSDSEAAALDVHLRAPAPTVRAWHGALHRSMLLIEDLDAAKSSPPSMPTTPQLQPLHRERLENELNTLFEDAFEACAGAARAAVEALEPLMEACLAKLLSSATVLPPRPDLFAYYASGMHHRFRNVYQVLLVRYDLDRVYLDTQGQPPPSLASHREVLEPSLMLSLIGWAKRYEERMAAVGAGAGRQLLSEAASESLISAYLHACRQLTRQWATNIVFCEQQAMVQKDAEAGILSMRDGGGGGYGRGSVSGMLTEGVLTMAGEGGQKQWFTELHLDLFRIVHEHVELGIGTGIEVVLFNVLLASADFLVDVQNEMLRKVRHLWRSLGFVYLCALINNCRRCIELWDKVLERCASEPSPLSEALAQNLHLGYVSDGFINLGHAAMQLAARSVLVQLERPLGALFSSTKLASHSSSAEMAALIDHFLSLVRRGVAGSHATRIDATRTCAICMQQLLCTYGVMLFVQEQPLTAATPAVLTADLAAFEGLLAKHCASGQFGSRNRTAARAGAEALHRLLVELRELLQCILVPGAREGSAGEPGTLAVFTVSGSAARGTARDADEIVKEVSKLRVRQPLLPRELLLRLLRKCRVPALGGRKAVSVLDASDAAASRQSVAGWPNRGHGSPARPVGHANDEDDVANAYSHFFSIVNEASQLGRKFSMRRLIELQQSGTRRWA